MRCRSIGLGWLANGEILVSHGHAELAAQIYRFLAELPPPTTDQEACPALKVAHAGGRRVQKQFGAIRDFDKQRFPSQSVPAIAGRRLPPLLDLVFGTTNKPSCARAAAVDSIRQSPDPPIPFQFLNVLERVHYRRQSEWCFGADLRARSDLCGGQFRLALPHIALSEPLLEDEEALKHIFKERFAAGADGVIDYLWGKSTERLLMARREGRRKRQPDPVRRSRHGQRVKYTSTKRGTAVLANRPAGQCEGQSFTRRLRPASRSQHTLLRWSRSSMRGARPTASDAPF